MSGRAGFFDTGVGTGATDGIIGVGVGVEEVGLSIID
jgi:hypothetical protein